MRGEGGLDVRRWWFVALVVSALFSYFTPSAFAECGEHGDAAGGRNLVALCCGGANSERGGEKHGSARVINTNHFTR